MLRQFEIKGLCPIRIKIDSVVWPYTPASPSVPEMEGIYATRGHPFKSESVWPSGKALGW